MMASADGPIETFPLRGIKDSPPYLHDGRLLTLEDIVEFFNLVLETKLSGPERARTARNPACDCIVCGLRRVLPFAERQELVCSRFA
jgi:cytochrome c peroxidase